MSMRKPCIILDCDDVLVACNEYAIQLLNERTGSKFTLNDINHWGRMGNELDQRLELFNNPAFVKNQPLYPGARDFVDRLKRFANVKIVTSVPQNCVAAREEFLQKNFSGIEIEIAEDKSVFFSDVMIDDNIDHLQRAKTRFPIVYTRPWNQGQRYFLAVSSFDQCLSLIKAKVAK